MKPRIWSLQTGVESDDHVYIFNPTLMRPVRYDALDEVELVADNTEVVNAKRFELKEGGLSEARMAFNCAEIYKRMAEAGVLNRGSDCDLHEGMFDLSARSRKIPYAWSLPHYYLVQSNDSTQHPRSNLLGFVTPTGPRYRNIVVVEPESGRVLQSMYKEQISVKLPSASKNYFFTKHKQVILPLYWVFETHNATIMERQLLAGFQSSFSGLNAGFIAFSVLGGVSLVGALIFGMLLYRQSSLQTVEEKRKKIRAELESAMPSKDRESDETDALADGEFM